MILWFRRIFAWITSPLPQRVPSLFVIYLASVLHIVWATLLSFSAEAAKATPVAPIVNMFGGRASAIAVLSVVAALGILGAWLHHNPDHDISPTWLATSLMPQQFLLFVSASGGIHAAWAGHYADGTRRPWPFIVGDQLPIMLMALLYMTAILVVARTQKLKGK